MRHIVCKQLVSGLTMGMTVLMIMQACHTSSETALFQRQDSTQTHIHFVNRIRETEKLNILEYLYFYNGGGVSAGDVNNDGRPDLYFVSSQGENKLYLNKTEPGQSPTFEDITQKAGVAGFADWQTGVTMVDVNGDGRLDIYVCAVANYKGLEGGNELYINDGNGPDGIPTFTEKAAEYGLDFTGFSTQAAFFDYDHDGDLDCFLLNHAVHTSRSHDLASTRHYRLPEAGDYLFENPLISQSPRKVNQTVKFKDVSEQAGIFGAAMGYGLGVSVADLNNDGWEDIYVSNDFHEDDYYYVNNGGKGGGKPVFVESSKQAFGHVSRFSMGNDVADINNDGYQDIMTLDMYPEDETVEKSSHGEDALDVYIYKLTYGYMNQYSRNCLQLSQSGKRFIDVGAMAGVAATDWSWAPLLADFDNDGLKDLFITNGIARRPNNLDYVKYAMSDSVQLAANTSVSRWKAAIDRMPEGNVHNYLYRGGPDMHFADKSQDWGFDKPDIANGAAYADLDNDGDLDLITNNLNDQAGLYVNRATDLFPANHFLKIKLTGNAPNGFGVGAKVVLKSKGTLQLQQLMPTRGFESSVEPVLLFGLATQPVVDSLIVIWPGQQVEIRTNVKADQTIELAQADAHLANSVLQVVPSSVSPLFDDVTSSKNIPYRHVENSDYYDFFRESLMPFQVSTEGPKLAVGDVNGDGREDFFVGGAKWQSGSLYLQQPDAQFRRSGQPAIQADSLAEDVDARFFDADGDGDLDLYVVSGGNEFSGKDPQLVDRLYLNNGKGIFSRSTGIPPLYGNKSCVRPFDVDQDGDMDLFVGGRVLANAYGKSPKSYLLINDGKNRNGQPHFSDQTAKLAPGLSQAGMITDAVWTDINGDKRPDLLLTGDWMPVKFCLNEGGRLGAPTSVTDPDVPMNGLWQCMQAADFDQDGDQDLIVGNLGLNNKFIKQESAELRMWVGDFDGNKTTDQVLVYNRLDEKGKVNWYPVAFKDELGKQLPGLINKRFTNYEQIAGKPIDEIFTKEELAPAEKLTVNQFASVYLENQHGHFVVHPLPRLAQTSKLFALWVTDINQDGKLDVLSGGNFYGASTYQGRYDANNGLVLTYSGKQRKPNAPLFDCLSSVENGFDLSGEVRDIKPINAGNRKLWLVARNNAPLQVFAQTKPPHSRLIN